VAEKLRSAPGIAAVASVRLDQSTVNGKRATLGTVDPGGLAQLERDVRPGTVILFTGSDAARGVRAGDRIRVAASGGRAATLTVAELTAGRSEVGDALVTWDDFARLHPATGDDLVLVKAADGVSPAASRAAVDAVTTAYPLVSVASMAQWRTDISNEVDQLITVVATLLAFAILIALIGIMNTLSLSVFERTRESALTRALGLTRGQLRATLLVEALLMGAVGALVGVGFGLLYGWATSRVIFSGITAVTTVPVGQLLLYLAIAVLAAVVAAVLPARRAARSSIVAALADT
jgi:putative ABC transport system permease protein